MQTYNNAIALRPNDPDLFFNRGRLYFLSADLELAAKDIEAVLRLKPEDSESITFLKQVYSGIDKNLRIQIEDLEQQKIDPELIDKLQEKLQENGVKLKKLLNKLSPQDPN